MFKRMDYRIYFADLRKIEKKMASDILELKGMLSDRNELALLDHIYDEELSHVALCDGIIKMLENKK